MQIQQLLPRRRSVVLAIAAVLTTVPAPARAQVTRGPTQGLISESPAFYAVAQYGDILGAELEQRGHRGAGHHLRARFQEASR